MKFCQKHYLGRSNAALRVGVDRLRTLVSMETDSSHNVIIWENGVSTFSRMFFIRSFLYLQVKRKCIESRIVSNFSPI